MRFLTALGLALVIVVGQTDDSHARFRHLWSRALDADADVSFPPSTIYSSPRVVAVGSNGDFFVLAQASNHVSFGGSQTGPGVVVARLNANGNEIWSRTLSADYLNIAGIAAGDSGTLVIAGSYRGTLNFGGVAITSVQSSGDIFLAKLDADGSVLWHRSFGDRSEQSASSITLAPGGDILLTGSNNGSVDFGGGLIRSNGSNDAFLVRLRRSDGGHVWSRGYGQTGSQNGQVVSVGGDGRIALTCQLTSGGIDLGGGLITPYGGGDIVVAVLDSNAGHVWSRLIGSPQYEGATDVAFDESGNMYMCGHFERSMITGGDFLVAEPGAARTGFVLSYGPAGEFRWSYALYDSLDSSGLQIDIAEGGECVLLASKVQSLDFAGTSLPAARFVLIDFDGFGNPASALAFGEPNGYGAAHMGILGNRIYLAVSTDGKIDLGGDVLSPASRLGMFLGRVDIAEAPRVTISDFTARAEGASVELQWNVASAEALSNYYLTRRIDGSSQARAIHSAPAQDGAFEFVDPTHPLPGHLHTYELTVGRDPRSAIP